MTEPRHMIEVTSAQWTELAVDARRRAAQCLIDGSRSGADALTRIAEESEAHAADAAAKEAATRAAESVCVEEPMLLAVGFGSEEDATEAIRQWQEAEAGLAASRCAPVTPRELEAAALARAETARDAARRAMVAARLAAEAATHARAEENAAWAEWFASAAATDAANAGREATK